MTHSMISSVIDLDLLPHVCPNLQLKTKFLDDVEQFYI